MRCGISLPNLGEYGDPHTLVALAREAEGAGWDGVFVWDCVYIEVAERGSLPTADPWIALAAIAMATSRIRIGPIVAPIARRRPWKLARETVTLDHLSNGRLILPVGYGAIDDGAFCRVGEDTDLRIRVQKVEEGLEILSGLWSGKPFDHQGAHYRTQEMTFLPRPVQSPRIPIWLDAVWPRMRSTRRALRYDGIIPSKKQLDRTNGPMAPEDFLEMKTWIDQHQPMTAGFDVIREGENPGNREGAAQIVQPFADAGVTWWIEAVWKHFYRGTPDSMRERIRQGPPL